MENLDAVFLCDVEHAESSLQGVLPAKTLRDTLERLPDFWSLLALKNADRLRIAIIDAAADGECWWSDL
jgi:hypothetical protein